MNYYNCEYVAIYELHDKKCKTLSYLKYNRGYQYSWQNCKLEMIKFRLSVRPQVNSKQKNLVNIKMSCLQTDHVFTTFRTHMMSEDIKSMLIPSLLYYSIEEFNVSFPFILWSIQNNVLACKISTSGNVILKEKCKFKRSICLWDKEIYYNGSL
jgi:hypothetical protein